MSLYPVFEGVIVVGLLALSVRHVWRTVLRPILKRPAKADCGAGCTGCETSHPDPLSKRHV